MQRRRLAAVEIVDRAAAPSPSGAQSSAFAWRGPAQAAAMTSANGPVPAESGVCAATMNGAPSSHSRAGSSRLAEVTALADLFTAKGRAAMTSFRSRAPSPGMASSRQRTASSAASKNSVPRRVNPPPLHSQTGSGRSPLTRRNAAAPAAEHLAGRRVDQPRLDGGRAGPGRDRAIHRDQRLVGAIQPRSASRPAGGPPSSRALANPVLVRPPRDTLRGRHHLPAASGPAAPGPPARVHRGPARGPPASPSAGRGDRSQVHIRRPRIAPAPTRRAARRSPRPPPHRRSRSAGRPRPNPAK